MKDVYRFFLAKTFIDVNKHNLDIRFIDIDNLFLTQRSTEKMMMTLIDIYSLIFF